MNHSAGSGLVSDPALRFIIEDVKLFLLRDLAFKFIANDLVSEQKHADGTRPVHSLIRPAAGRGSDLAGPPSREPSHRRSSSTARKGGARGHIGGSREPEAGRSDQVA